MGRDVRIIATFAYGIGLGIYLCFAVMFDIFAARTGFASVSLLIVVLSSIPLLVIVVVMRKAWMAWAFVVSLVLVIAMTVTAWHPRKRFVRQVQSIREGMTLAEVDRVMAGYLKGRGAKWAIPGTPAPSPPKDMEKLTGTITYRWNATNSAYDSDWGLVTFEEGKVTEAEFLAD